MYHLQDKVGYLTKGKIYEKNIKLHKKKLPIVEHFNSANHSINDISLMGIETIHKKHDSILRKRESFWIAKLHTLQPHGINADP